MVLCFNGCMKEARAQDKLVSERLVNWADTLVTVQVAPLRECVIQFADSSNSTTDTFKVYLVSPLGDEVLATLLKVNDTIAIASVTPTTGTVIPGDGVVRFYKVQCPAFYSLKIVRTNVASIGGTAVTGKVSHITVFAWMTSGFNVEEDYIDLTFQDSEGLPGHRNTGYHY